MKLFTLFLHIFLSFQAFSQENFRLLNEENLIRLRKKATLFLIQYKNGSYSGDGTAFYVGDEGFIVTAFHLVYPSIANPDAHSFKLVNSANENIDYDIIHCSNSSHAIDLCLLKVRSENKSEYYFPLKETQLGSGHPLLALGVCNVGKIDVQRTSYVRTWANWQDEMGFNKTDMGGLIWLNRDTQLIQHKIEQCKGSSGGPLFDSQGDLKGLLSVIYRNSKGESYSMAVSVKEILKYIDDHKAENSKSSSELKKLLPKIPNSK